MSNGETSSENSDGGGMEKVRRYAPWVAGGILLLGGVASILDPGAGIVGTVRAVLAGLIFIGGAVIALPPTRHLVGEHTGVEFAGWMIAIAVLVALFAGGAISPPVPDDPDDAIDDDALEESPTPENDDEEQEDTQPADETPTSADTSVDTPPPETPTREQERTGVWLLAEETFSDAGSITTIAPGGDRVAFGLQSADRFVGYDAEADAFTSVEGGVGEPSQMELRDDGYATVSWPDQGTFGGIDTTGGHGPEWMVEYADLDDVDPVADHSAVAAAARQPEWEAGPGRVGVVSEGGEWLWDESLEDAEPASIAVTDAGEHTVVGTVEYWDEDAEEYRGSVGVRLLDGETGEERWRHETDGEPTRVAIHEDRELVVVSIQNEGLVALTFDGEVVWDADGQAGMDMLSDDGSTVVAISEREVVAYDTDSGDERWRTDADVGPLGFVSIDETGDRVAVTSPSQEQQQVYVFDEGELVWEDERDNHAAMDISADGATWSVIETDVGANEAHVAVYRDADVE